MDNQKEHLVKKYLERGVLPSEELVNEHIEIGETDFSNMSAVITKDHFKILSSQAEIDWHQFDRLRVHFERGKPMGYKQYVEPFFSQSFSTNNEVESVTLQNKSTNVQITYSHLDDGTEGKYSVAHFASHLKKRYYFVEKILRIRPELHNTVSISRVIKKQSREDVSIIGMVADKSETKNGNILLTLEDPTGRISVLINKGKPNLFNEARDIVFDEVIGVSGVCGKRIVFANNIFWPDIPFTKELKKAPDDAHAVFLSDVHVGSEYFLPEAFDRFLRWIRQESGSDKQKALASKVKYIFIAGDLVDGIGIYPGQDKELTITDIYEQYNEFTRLIKQIPEHIHIILCPGNHDAVRLAEPQPIFDPDYCKSIYELPNVTIVSNPSIVTIHASENFSGIDVLLYHGYSFDYYVANVDSIRNKGGYHRSDLIMKFLLKRRHLAPTHNSALRIPYNDKDPLFINRIPDILLTGHIHYSLVAHYRNITLVSGSCWQGMTDFQQKLGHKPEPARAPVINLQTREVKILKFI